MTFLFELLIGLTLLVLGLCTCLVVYARWHYGSLEALGIPVMPPHWLLGSKPNHHKMVHHMDDLDRLKTMGQVYGVYEGRQPCVYVSDPELIRQICTSPDHFDKRPADLGHALANELLDLIPTSDKWRTVRNHLTPILTTGKLKQMDEIMIQLSDQHLDVLRDLIRSGEDGQRVKIDFAQFLAPFAIEMIAKILCGIQLENVRDPNNQFVKQMRAACLGDGFNFDWSYNWTQVFPFLLNLFPNFAGDGLQFFESAMRGVLDAREASGLKHPDMVGKLLELRQKIPTPEYKRMGITETTVLAQALELFMASYLGVLTEMNYLMYFMALNPEIQDKLTQEVDTVLGKNGKKFDQSMIGEFRYLTACLSETFRIQSAFFRGERLCMKDWQYESYKIRKGMTIVFPFFAIHHNPDLYPNPTQFDPERFLSGGASTNSYSFMTFGQGPRACIGQRFIYDMMKIFVVKFFQHFRVEQRKDTVWKVHPGNHIGIQHDPIYVDLVLRKSR